MLEALTTFAATHWDAVRATPSMKALDAMNVFESMQHPLSSAVSIVARSCKCKITVAYWPRLLVRTLFTIPFFGDQVITQYRSHLSTSTFTSSSQSNIILF